MNIFYRFNTTYSLIGWIFQEQKKKNILVGYAIITGQQLQVLNQTEIVRYALKFNSSMSVILDKRIMATKRVVRAGDLNIFLQF